MIGQKVVQMVQTWSRQNQFRLAHFFPCFYRVYCRVVQMVQTKFTFFRKIKKG